MPPRHYYQEIAGTYQEDVVTTKAIGYCRVSSFSQAESGLSLEAQEAKIRKYADLYDLDIIRIEVDAGEGAGDMDRPALQRALAALDAHEADGLLVAKLDRLTRSVADWGWLRAKYFAPGKRLLMSVVDQIDLRTATGVLVLNITIAIAEWERGVISERTKDAYTAKRARGERWGSVPYGWRDAGGMLEHDPVEWPIAQGVRVSRAQGMSLRKIAASMPAPTRGGKDWTAEQIRRICVEER